MKLPFRDSAWPTRRGRGIERGDRRRGSLESLELRRLLASDLLGAASVETDLVTVNDVRSAAAPSRPISLDFGDATNSPVVDAGPTLTGLSVAGTSVSLFPAFAAATQRYSIYTGAGSSGVTVTATTGVGNALEINGQAAASGVGFPVPTINPGEKITIEVSNAADEVRTYELMYLPELFPNIDVTTPNPGVSDGFLYVSLTSPYVASPPINMILDNNGVPVFLLPEGPNSIDFKQHPNGQYSYASQIGVNEHGRSDFVRVILDADFNEVGRFQVTNGVNHTDFHDFLILPDGNYVFVSYNGEIRPDPLDNNVPRLYEDSIIQLVDRNTYEELFRWNSKDHIPPSDWLAGDVEYAHVNSVYVDPLDGQLVASFRNSSQVMKIDWDSGDVLWKFGGNSTDFTIVDPLGGTCTQHTASILDNGNLLVFDNGVPNTCPDRPEYAARTELSRAAEYELNETTMTATLVWSYQQQDASNVDFYGRVTGSAQRLWNGNTIIDWGFNQRGTARADGVVTTEVDANGVKVFELAAKSPDDSPWRSYRTFRFGDQRYPTLLADDGARHVLGGGLKLGEDVDDEADAHPSSDASGDDLLDGNDDEDGIEFASLLIPGEDATVNVQATVPGGLGATPLLNAWIDFNNDGSWDDAGEHVLDDVAAVDGLNALTFPVPMSAIVDAHTVARFRLSTDANLSYDGVAADGEVEDHPVFIGTPRAADLAVTTTASQANVTAGDTFTYTVTVLNNGPDRADNVVVNDALPADVTLVSSDGCQEDPAGAPVCSLGSLPVGASASYTLTVDVDAGIAAPGTITNQATVSSSTPDPASPNDSDSVDTGVVTTGASLEDGVLLVVGTDGDDVIEIREVAGQYRVRVNAPTLESFFPVGSVAGIEIHASSGNDNVLVSNNVARPSEIYGSHGNDFLRGGPLADEIHGGSGQDTIKGSSGPNTLIGGPGDDQIFGGPQSDEITDLDGNNIVRGRGGADSIVTGGGNDNIRGGNGPDIIRSGAGDDTVFGDGGNDEIYAGSGADVVSGGGGDDLIDAAFGFDTVFGNSGADVLVGGAGNDLLEGGGGRDVIIGGDGEDQLDGGNGFDVLVAGATLYDANNAALEAILAEWTSSRGYLQRVDNLRNGTGPSLSLAGVSLVSATTVFTDADADQLMGSGDTDFFLADAVAPGLDNVLDQAIGEELDEL